MDKKSWDSIKILSAIGFLFIVFPIIPIVLLLGAFASGMGWMDDLTIMDRHYYRRRGANGKTKTM